MNLRLRVPTALLAVIATLVAPVALLATVARVAPVASAAASQTPSDSAPASTAASTLGTTRVVILHTNDIHGQVLPRAATWLKDVNPVPDSGGLPRLAGTLRKLVAEETAAGAAVIVCDGGDWFQGTPEGMIERGRGFLKALAEVGFDGAVVGNHEFDHGVDVFIEHLAHVDFPALLANVRLPDGSPLPGTRDWIVVERAGLRIGLTGFLTTSTPTITHKQTKELRWEDPEDAWDRVSKELGQSVDLLIPVTHMGVEEDVALARARPDIPLIVGGHSHTFLRKGVREGKTLIVQGGAKASVIGRVELTLVDGKVANSVAQHVDLYGEPPREFRVAGVDAQCEVLVARAAERMDEVVGVLGRPLEVSRRALVNTSAGNFITDIMRERAGADLAIHNRGGIRTSLGAGPVTRRQLFMILPFDNSLETITMSGADVIELFRRSIESDRKWPLEFSGVQLQVRRVEGKPVLVDVLLGGEPLDPEAEVRLATNSFLGAGGDGWELLASQTVRELDGVLLRELLEIHFDGGPATPDTEQRYEIVR